MTNTDRARLDLILTQANELMNGKGNGITNADVIECILGDIQRVKSGRAPEELGTLVEQDKAFAE